MKGVEEARLDKPAPRMVRWILTSRSVHHVVQPSAHGKFKAGFANLLGAELRPLEVRVEDRMGVDCVVRHLRVQLGRRSRPEEEPVG